MASTSAFRPEPTGWGAQTYAIHIHAELEESDFKRYIADMVNGTLNPDDEKPEVAGGGESAAKDDWCYPCTASAGHALQHLTALSKARAGFYPIGGNGLWHGGIQAQTAGADDLQPVHASEVLE